MMKNKKIKSCSARNIAKFVCSAILLFVMLIMSASALSSCSFGRGEDASYVKVESSGGALSVEIPIAAGDYEEVYLFGTDVWQGMDTLNGANRIAKAKISGKTAKAKVEIRDRKSVV